MRNKNKVYLVESYTNIIANVSTACFIWSPVAMAFGRESDEGSLQMHVKKQKDIINIS